MSSGADAIELLCADAEPLAARIAAEEQRLLESFGEAAWLRRFRDALHGEGSLRRRAHRDALVALAGVAGGGPDSFDHTSDWLRNAYYLYADLRPEIRATLQERAAARVVEELSHRAATAVAAVERSLASLAAQLPPALGAFACLPALDALPDFTRSGAEAYWDAAARRAPLFSVDWASFGREDLFDCNGRRAARWLLDSGHARPSARILDVGCGAGRVARHLAPAVGHVTAVDISAEMLRLAERRLAGHANAAVLKTDGRSLPVPSQSVDFAFSLFLLIHLHDPALRASLFAEVHRVLRPGGRFLLTLLEREPWIEALAREVGFEVAVCREVDSRAINSFRQPWDWMWVIERS